MWLWALYPSIAPVFLQFDIGLNTGYCAAWRPNTGAQGRANNSTGEFGHHNWMLKTTLEDWRYNTDQHSTLNQDTTGILLYNADYVLKWQIDIPQWTWDTYAAGFIEFHYRYWTRERRVIEDDTTTSIYLQRKIWKIWTAQWAKYWETYITSEEVIRHRIVRILL